MSPDPQILEAVRIAGITSNCRKSNRGVVIFHNPSGALYKGLIVGRGANDQPRPLVCDGSAECRNACSKLCVHAESEAIRDALIEATAMMTRAGLSVDEIVLAGGPLRGAILVHAKVVEEQIVAGGPPSCWQCSREVLRNNLAGVWLFEDPRDAVPHGLCRYTGKRISDCELCHATSCGQHGATFACSCDLAARHRTAAGLVVTLPNKWRFYSALEFHKATLAHPDNQLPLMIERRTPQ